MGWLALLPQSRGMSGMLQIPTSSMRGEAASGRVGNVTGGEAEVTFPAAAAAGPGAGERTARRGRKVSTEILPEPIVQEGGASSSRAEGAAPPQCQEDLPVLGGVEEWEEHELSHLRVSEE